ncbi:MAG: hypothetical protein ACREIA_03895 [Opitutaceae bacterium]
MAVAASLSALQQQREQLVEEMRAIDRLRRGALSQHFLRRHQNGKTTTHGPYFVLQGCLYPEFLEKHVRHLSVVMLPRVHEQLSHIRMVAKREIHRRGFHEVGPRTDDVN